MNINKLNVINNQSLNEYVKFKDLIIFQYKGFDLKFLFETIFLAIAVDKESKKIGKFKVAINCNKEYKDFIPDQIEYIDLNNSKIEIPGLYEINKISNFNYNHIELAKKIGINVPFNLKNIFENNIIAHKKSVIIACNGTKEISLPEEHEQYIYQHFNNNGYKVTVLHLPNYYHSNHWSNSIAVKPSSFEEIINIIQSNEIIISTDNCYLALANTFLNKKVIGIFGPTQPRSLLLHNSMKVLQIVDENNVSDHRLVKSCPCEGYKFCHRGYIPGSYPYCFSNISFDTLVQRIKNYLEI